MDRYAIALNKKPTDTSMKAVPADTEAYIEKSAEEYRGPACHYECMNQDLGCRVRSGMGWICSRSPGHKGPHVACAGKHDSHIWYMLAKMFRGDEGRIWIDTQ